MKLQLDENTLKAYINEAIRQELTEAIQVDFNSLGPAEGPQRTTSWNRRYFNLDKQKQDLEAGTFGKSGWFGRTSKDAITVLKDLGYSDEQIRKGISSGAIRTGKLTDTNGFTKYDRQKKQNRKTGNLMAAAGMDVLGNTPNGNATASTGSPVDSTASGQDVVRASAGQGGEGEVNWPWNSITQEEINAAKQAQQAAMRAAAARRAQQQQAQQQATQAQQQPATQQQPTPQAQPKRKTFAISPVSPKSTLKPQGQDENEIFRNNITRNQNNGQ